MLYLVFLKISICLFWKNLQSVEELGILGICWAKFLPRVLELSSCEFEFR